jgi:transketolase
MHTLKPLDEEAVITTAQETGLIITVEEHSVYGGLGAAVAQVVVSTKPVPMVMLGIPDEDAVPGKSAEIFEYYGLHSKGIASAAAKAFAAKNGQGMR